MRGEFQVRMLDGTFRCGFAHGPATAAWQIDEIPCPRGLTRNLVAMLAMEPGLKAVAVEAMIERLDLWGPWELLRRARREADPNARDPQKPAASISQAVARFGGPLKGSPLELVMQADSVDALKFERLAEEAFTSANESPETALACANEALALWGRGLPSFEDGAVAEAATRFEKLRKLLVPGVTVLARLIELERLASGAFKAQEEKNSREALRLAREALAVWNPGDPLRVEHSSWQQLVVRGGALSSQVEAMTRELAPPLNNLPAPDEQDLIGRTNELSKVMELLRPWPDSQVGVVLIDGVGGVGKTALAKAVAHRYVDRDHSANEGFSAVVWVSGKQTELNEEIRRIEPTLRDLKDLFHAVALTVKRPDILALRSDEQRRAIADLLRDLDFPVLLVVDNLETVTDPDLFAFLRLPTPPTRIILTTRHRVDGAQPIRLEGLSKDESAELVRARAAHLSLTLGDTEVETIGKITGGVPLAIFVILGEIKHGYSLAQASDRVRSARGDFAEFSFAVAVANLSAPGQTPARDMLFAASLFERSATADALGFVAGEDAGLTARQRDAGLARLLDGSLLNRDERTGRFRMLSLLKDYLAAELGRDLALKERLTKRWLDWHLKLTPAAGVLDLDTEALRVLRRDHPNVLGAVQYASWHEPAVFITFIEALPTFWMSEGHWDEFETYVEKAMVSAAPAIRLRFSNRLLWLAVLREDIEAAEIHRRASELLLRRIDLPYERMRFLDFAGQLEMARGDLDAARSLFELSLTEAREIPDLRGVFATEKYLGEVACLVGDWDEAKQRHANAAGSLGDPTQPEWRRGHAHLDHLMGLLNEGEGHSGLAIDAYDSCLATLKVHRDVRLGTRAKEGKARCLLALGQCAEAADLYRDTMKEYVWLGMQAASARVLALADEAEASGQ